MTMHTFKHIFNTRLYFNQKRKSTMSMDKEKSLSMTTKGKMRQQLGGCFVQEGREPTWWQRGRCVFDVFRSVISCGTKQT